MLPPILLPLFIGGLVSAVMAIFLSRWLTRPLRDVSRGLKALASGHLDTRILDSLRTSNSEIRDLGRDFDLAAERLHALTEGRSRLFHDISHEIRSPLARLRAAVGLIEVNPARGGALAKRMEGDIARLDHLVDEILTLARLDRGEPLGTVAVFDLLDIVENIIFDANFEGREKNVSARYSGAEKLELLGNPELLHRACENVVRNALSYSPNGGTVSVTGAATKTKSSSKLRTTGQAYLNLNSRRYSARSSVSTGIRRPKGLALVSRSQPAPLDRMEER